MENAAFNPNNQIPQNIPNQTPNTLPSSISQKFDDTLQNIMTQSAVIADQVTGPHSSRKSKENKNLSEIEETKDETKEDDIPLTQVIHSLQKQLTFTHQYNPNLAKKLKLIADEKLNELESKGFHTKKLHLPN